MTPRRDSRSAAAVIKLWSGYRDPALRLNHYGSWLHLLCEVHAFLFNLLFWLGGCGLLGVGVWLSVSQGSFATLSPSFPTLSAANLVITLGTVVMFFIVLLIILLAELILLILFFVYTDKVSENARRDLKEGLGLYTSENNAGLSNAWNTIQTEWHCCGVDGPHGLARRPAGQGGPRPLLPGRPARLRPQRLQHRLDTGLLRQSGGVA
ncbi:unnamed protein product [Gadus morhua 'NCC']